MYAGIVGIVATSVISFSVWMLRMQGSVESQNRALLEGERAMTAISREIRGALDVYESTSVLEMSPGQISLKTTRSVPEGDPFTYVDVYLCQSKVCVKREGQDPVAVSSQDATVEHLEFIRSGERLFRVVLTVNGVELQSAFTMRSF